jgi:hypothetical protein
MPTRKQRRRNQKARRHEYEYVYLDDEGNEVPVDPSELRAEKNGQRDPKPSKGGSGKPAAGRGPGGRRVVEPPSWRRSARRALIFGPLLVVAMMLFNRNLPLVQQLFPAVFLIAFFIPFSYFTDSLAYRMFQKRLARRDNAKTR